MIRERKLSLITGWAALIYSKLVAKEQDSSRVYYERYRNIYADERVLESGRFNCIFINFLLLFIFLIILLWTHISRFSSHNGGPPITVVCYNSRAHFYAPNLFIQERLKAYNVVLYVQAS